MPHIPRHAARLLIASTTAAVLACGLGQLPVQARGNAHQTTARTHDQVQPAIVETPADGLADLDTRGTIGPDAAQTNAARALGAQVRWNSFGTPASIAPLKGSLGPVTSSNPVTAARSWLSAHADLLGLSPAQVAGLQLVNNQRLADSPARAVLFRQDFGGPAPALDSMVTVGIGGGAVQYVSSSLTRTDATSVPTATLSPTQAWQKAAANVGEHVAASDIGAVTDSLGWSRFRVAGLAQQQVARLRSLADAHGVVRPVYETNVVDVAGGSASAWTVMVDAIDGAVLVRQNKVENSNDSFQFQASITATECGPMHPFEVTDDATRTIVATFAEVVTTNDIVVKLFGPAGQLLTTGDAATSPEVAMYTADAIPAGTYSVQVCPFADPTAPFVAPGNYAGSVVTSDQGSPSTPSTGNPMWRFFGANPVLNFSPTATPKNSLIGCWKKAKGCTDPDGPFVNVAAAGPWDINARTGTPTFTTVGNNANTHEAWLSPDSPGGLFQAPVSATRSYTTPFTDAWNNSKCDPTNLVPGGNDIDAVVGNLFTSHNLMHDFAYYLGFTERNYNLQQDNLNRNDDPTRENDPEIGNAQAGALSGGSPSFLGRDNANQIALQDGVPGITNQYLFGPIAGAFYSPCVDGSVDMTVVGHEYTHAISNRMVAGPDEGLTSEQGGAMGESWSDLDALEYLYEHSYSTGADPWVEGPYATGNKSVGIRDYALDANPLNYGDYGFDSTGDEVHADGEIWNGTQYEVRQALVQKYDAAYPSSDKALQLRCAKATELQTPLPVEQCPGNRRWLQLIYDSFLLQQGATSMLDARDAMLAADRMRFGGADQTVMWNAFARRGMGSDASTPNADSGDTTPGFASPRVKNATVWVLALDGSTPMKGKVYIGRYEARATPSADTDADTPLTRQLTLAPGTYDLLFVGPGTGMTRSSITVTAGEKVRKVIAVERNLASSASGATVIGSSEGSLNASDLIDDSEATSWAGVNSADPVDDDAHHPYVSVELASPATIHSIRVSALLHPAPASDDPTGLLAGSADDPDSGARFTALRKFALEVCNAACDTSGAKWKRVYVSPSDAFPATAPRPVAPNLTLRSFDVPDVHAAAVRLVALENQCTGTAAYAGEQDNDPSAGTDCKADSDSDLSVRAAELEVY